MSEIEIVEERLRRFAASPDDRDWPDVLRRAGAASPGGAVLPIFAARGGRPRWPLLVAAAAAVALAAGLSYALIPRSSGTTHGKPDLAIGGVFLIPPNTTQITSSVAMKTEVPFTNATLDIEVRRASFPPGADPQSFDPYSEHGQVVFKETVPMTNVSTGAPIATWSGTVSVNDWSGGCQSNANYGIAANGRNSAGVIDSMSTSQWFTCRPSS